MKVLLDASLLLPTLEVEVEGVSKRKDYHRLSALFDNSSQQHEVRNSITS